MHHTGHPVLIDTQTLTITVQWSFVVEWLEGTYKIQVLDIIN